MKESHQQTPSRTISKHERIPTDNRWTNKCRPIPTHCTKSLVTQVANCEAPSQVLLLALFTARCSASISKGTRLSASAVAFRCRHGRPGRSEVRGAQGAGKVSEPNPSHGFSTRSRAEAAAERSNVEYISTCRQPPASTKLRRVLHPFFPGPMPGSLLNSFCLSEEALSFLSFFLSFLFILFLVFLTHATTC